MDEPGGPPAPTKAAAEATSSTQPGPGGEDPAGQPSKPAASTRKRTKTGCLTCRKRRIKCDEGRPTCNNCIKSKRACEGYNQRVVFKDPIGTHPYADPYGQYRYDSAAAHGLEHLAANRRLPGQPPLAAIAPKPPQLDHRHPQGLQYGPPYHPTAMPGPGSYVPPPGMSYPQAGPYGHQPDALANPHLAQDYAQVPQQQFQHGDVHQQPPLHYYPSGADAVPSRQEVLAYSDGRLSHGQDQVPDLQPQAEEYYESSDEDAPMSDSDDGEQNTGSIVVPVLSGIYSRDARDTMLRSFSTFARNQAVGEYMSSPHATELRDSAKRKLFEHFMRVTGPTMSLYERHPFDPADNDLTVPATKSASNIWSYTFPLISLQHPALLHAMLALASLQVSKLQGAPPTAAHKHYHISLRRIAKNVSSSTKRLQPATVASTLLLSYFEVWNSEHTKWCSHLYGARTLFGEMPLRAMSRRFLPVKSLRERQKIMRKMGTTGVGDPLPQDPNMLDFELLSAITGYHVTAEDYGLKEDDLLRNVDSTVTERELENYENIRDLYWWYCKMDVYQSVIGGTRPFLEYEHWTQCPPRAPMSKIDSAFGTYDHLMLLLARLSTFTERDLHRKRKMNRPKGPPPAGAPSPPSFPGIMPTKDEAVRPPMGFDPPRQPQRRESPNDGKSDHECYIEALAEWEGIRRGFEIFESRLGPEFRPLAPEYTDRRDRPFGRVIQYRTYSVAGIWMNYYSGLISLHRSHPDMPPAAMQAVGAAARNTAVYANQVGRISAGMADDCEGMTDISTVLAAAFLESSFCLFVAAVQYQDDEQRKWTVQRMHDVTRLTAWQTATVVAHGCESTWTRAAQMGRGPPYVRAPDLRESHGSVWDRPRRLQNEFKKAGEGIGEETRVVVARADRTHYALGLLGVEDDMVALDLRDDAFSRLSG